jgi:predicted nucleotide-binding protein (sugar kinase/HSP70/actin superfamily)
MVGRNVSGSGLAGRTVFIPPMAEAGVNTISAAFRSVGIDATAMPPSDEETLLLGGRYSSGEECLPQKVTLGDTLKLLVHGKVAPEKMALFMPASNGPCRFGQYGPYMKMVLEEMGFGDVILISPTCSDGYSGVGEHADELLRTAWRAMVAGDLLEKLLLRVRPYETEKGAADRAFREALGILCRAVEVPGEKQGRKLARIVASLREGRELFRNVPTDFSFPRPLIGVVGEIFCRLNAFSNDDVLRKVEEAGGECWISDVTEWVWYTNADHHRELRRYGKALSFEMLGAKLKWHFQRKDEHALLEVFEGDFLGYEEPHDIREVMELARPYLVPEGTLGEMLLSVGKSVYLHRKGADGILDINPFSCMNGIVSEAVYPRVSRDCDGLPVRVLYFDGTHVDRRYELEIFMELVREYSSRKRMRRVLPEDFGAAAAAGV